MLLLLSLSSTNGQFSYTTNANNTLTITGYTGSGGTVNIPTNINGLTVTGIGNGKTAVFGSGLTGVIIPNTVTAIAGGTYEGSGYIYGAPFNGCPSLTNVSILGNTTIGAYAFYNCSNLTSVYIAGGAIGFEAFWLCVGNWGEPGQPPAPTNGLSSVTLGNGVTSIGEEAFLSDSFLSNIVIPGSVTNIGVSAFGACSLTNATISYGVTTIGDYAFAQNLLTSVYLPGSIVSVGDQAFYDMSTLNNVTIAAGVSSITAGAFQECFSLTNVFCLGNAPAVVGLTGDGPIFLDTQATVYYLPGTPGWSNTFGWNDGVWGFSGAPTSLWNPIIQTHDGHFGVHSNQFGFNITSTNTIPIVVEACTNLANPVWTPLTNVMLTNGSYYFSDKQWTNYPTRYYGVGFP